MGTEEKKETTKQDLVLVEALVLYWFNTDPTAIMQTIFPTAVESYIAEKVELYRQGLDHFWGMLDWDHRQRLIQAARNKYDVEAKRRIASWEA